mgnify:CR=1 FL=1
MWVDSNIYVLGVTAVRKKQFKRRVENLSVESPQAGRQS